MRVAVGVGWMGGFEFTREIAYGTGDSPQYASQYANTGGLLLKLRVPKALQGGLTFMRVAVGVGWMGGFEFTREIARKPYPLG